MIRDIKTVFKVTKAAATTIGGRVAPGQKRYVTFLAVDNRKVAGATSIALYLASNTVSNPGRATIVSAGTHRKWLLKSYGSDVTICCGKRPVCLPPLGPDPDNPLFTIASGSWLGCYSSANTATIFMQYFDE